MQILATIDFWGDGVGCFCHEAVTRALNSAFPDVKIDPTDLAYQKYDSVAHVPELEKSAWAEYLRCGPLYRFTVANGISGVFSRYEISFELSSPQATAEAATIQRFLSELTTGQIKVESGEDGE